jgi:hypothetical protein
MAIRERHSPCDCCTLLCPSGAIMTWVERRPARRLKALGGPATEDEPPGPYRAYMVEHVHRVCPSCHVHLCGGGEFRAITRDRGKLAVVVLVAIVALLLAAGPVLLPRLMSAFWRTTGEAGR